MAERLWECFVRFVKDVLHGILIDILRHILWCNKSSFLYLQALSPVAFYWLQTFNISFCSFVHSVFFLLSNRDVHKMAREFIAASLCLYYQNDKLCTSHCIYMEYPRWCWRVIVSKTNILTFTFFLPRCKTRRRMLSALYVLTLAQWQMELI